MIYTKEIEDQMSRAVQWLADHGGSGVQDRYGHVVAGGETARHIPALTWCRCVFSGCLIVPEGAGRIFTVEAVSAIKDRLARVNLSGRIS